MPFNGSGVFDRIYNWVQDALAGIPIEADRMDAEANDLANGLSNCITRNGQSVATANLPMGNHKLTGLTPGSTNGDSVEYSQLLGTIGFTGGTNYTVGTLGAALAAGLVNVQWFMTAAEVAQVQAGGTTIDLTPKLTAAQIWGGNRPLYLPAGTYSFTSLSFIGNKGGIIGDGIDVTILSVRSTVTTAIDLNETTDSNPNAGHFQDFTLQGNSLATNGFNVRYRHLISFHNVYVSGCTTGWQEKDTYTARHMNLRAGSCVTGLYLVGSNHASTFVGCTFTGNSSYQAIVQTNGTANDGNSALVFNGCDFEFGTSSSVGIDITCSDLSLVGCYIGEGIPGASIVNRGGLVTVSGGTMFYGNTTGSYGVTPLGGKTMVRGAQLNGQTNGGVNTLVGGGTGGKVAFYDVQFNGLVSGSPVIAGDVLDYGPQGTVYAPRFGKNWASETSNATASSAVFFNYGLRATVTAAPGPTPLLGMKGTLVNNSQWMDGSGLYLVLVYESSKTLNIALSGSGLGGLPTKSVQTSVPATSGTPNTAICFQATADTAAYTVIEAVQSSSAVNDTMTIYECFLADARMLNKGAGQFGNLYKC